MFELPVRKIHFYTPDIFEISLERGEYTFETGECAVLFNAAGDSRPYSMSSAPQADDLRFLVRRIPGGSLSDWLAARRPGDRVRLSPPFGEFRPVLDDSPVVLIATGVGISPFLSLLRNVGQASSLSAPASVSCLYGVRTQADAVELALLKQKTSLQLAVSREPDADHFNGRVTGLLETLTLPDEADVYLCGCDAMIDNVYGLLRARSVPAARIHTEVFFSSEESD